MSVSGEQSWARSTYPGHPSSKGPVSSSRPTSPFAESDISSHRLPVSTRPIKPIVPVPWYRAVTDDRVEPEPEPDSIMSRLENASLPSYLQRTRNNQATDASSTILSYSSPPPSSPPLSVANHYDSSPNASYGPSANGLNDVSRSSTPWSKNGYPRQAITATNPSTGHPSPLTKPIPDDDQDEDQDHEYSPDSTPERTRTLRRTPRSRRILSPVRLPDDDKSTNGSTSGPWKRRQSYPVHTVTSDSGSNRPATPPPEQESTVADTNRSSHSAHPDEPVAIIKSSPPSVTWSQKGYPLQQPTAGSTTGPVSPPLSDNGSHSERGSQSESKPESEPVSRSPVYQPHSTNQAAKEGSLWNRRTSYPLQVAASNANLRSSPTPPQSSTGKDPESAPEYAPASTLR